MWKFSHSHQSVSTCILDEFRPQTEDDLLQTIVPILESKLIGKPWVPINPVSLFEGALEKLRKIHAQLENERVQQTTNTKMQLWLDMLRGSGMVPKSIDGQTRLFSAHCFLVALARGVVHTVRNPNSKPDFKKLLGNGYLAWIVEVEEGRVWAKELLDKVNQYEWRCTPGDVLRPLYESFVDQNDRKDFGEVYTPDWLAEMMVKEVLDDEWCNESVISALSELRGQENAKGIGVLDPTCGSGTFLYHCTKRIMSCEKAKTLSSGQLADVICRLVHGIDIHPVAVEFSRATLLRALPTAPSFDDLALSVYQGDALMLRQTEKGTLFEPQNGELLICSPQEREIRIPREFSEHTEFPDMLRRMVEAASNGEALPIDIGSVMEQDADKIEDCHKALINIIEAEGNSVWTWYITNVIGPDRLSRKKVNRIVANPPWVKLSNIQSPERKRALENLAGKDGNTGNLGLWQGGNQAPHFDIAQLFIKRSQEEYLNDPDTEPSAWVTKASAISGGNWNKFRQHHFEYMAQTIDFSKVNVFGGGDSTRCCVLFEMRPSSSLDIDETTKVFEATCINSAPDASSSWDDAKLSLNFGLPDKFPNAESDYGPDCWRQGATIVPKVLTSVNRVFSSRGNPDFKTVTTNESNYIPWNVVQARTGEIPANWLLPLLTSKQLFPFGLSPSGFETAIIPCSDGGNLLSLEMARNSKFWAELDDLYQESRGLGTNTPTNLMDRINYSSALSTQMPYQSQNGYFVVYPAAGDVMRAAHISANSAIIESSIYRHNVSNVAEARYLVAVLNAPSLELAFRVSRTSGRSFHKNPWRKVPVPSWDRKNSRHQDLSVLAEIAEDTIGKMDLPIGQVAASRRIRERLTEEDILSEIDSIVEYILPDHVTKVGSKSNF